MDTDDTEESGGASLSIEQAASAFVKATSQGAQKGQPVQDKPNEGEEADDELQASDLDEGEEGGEPDDESQAEEEVAEEPDDKGRFVATNGKVKLPDGSVLTVGELINGNLRDRDYRQKTMGLSDERRAFEEQSSALKASMQQVNEQRAFMSNLLQQIMPPAPDPSLLEPGTPGYDPISYIAAKANYDNWMANINQLHSQSEANRQKAEQKMAKERNEKANSEGEKLLGKIPSLRDPAKLNAFATGLQTAGAAAGFTAEEIAGTVPYDHRMALVLHKAALWDKLQANKPKAVQQGEGRPPVQRSGKRMTPDAQQARRASDAVNRLKQTGSVADAAMAYLASRKG